MNMFAVSPQIFINYRRDDSQAFANLLQALLILHFGQDAVFLDTSSIPEGAIWPARIREALAAAKVVFVVIGKTWLTLQGKGGRRRIDLPNDWVRTELEFALQNGKILIPIRSDADASFPAADDLPESIVKLADTEGAEFRYEALKRDIDRLAETLRLHGVQPTGAGGTLLGDPAFYFDYLQTKYGYIDIKGIQPRNPKAQTFAIKDLYITLTYTARIVAAETRQAMGTINRRVSGAGKGSLEADAETHPIDLKQALSHPRLLVMGDPGSGKTTFLHKIACEAAEKFARRTEVTETSPQSQPLPLLIKIDSFCSFLQKESEVSGTPESESPAWLEAYLAKQSKEFEWNLSLADFQRWLKATKTPGTLLLLDGLDEAPSETLRIRVQKIVSSFSAIAKRSYPGVRIVVTSRPLEMTGTIDLKDFEVARINPLDKVAIHTFLGKWCAALHTDSPDRAHDHLTELLRDLNARPDIRRMATNPVMLTALAVVHWNEGRMPEQRAELYASVLHWLDESRRAQRERRTPHLPLGRPVFEDLALGMQMHPSGMRKSVTRREAAEMVWQYFGKSRDRLSIDEAEKFLEQEQLDGGIVVERQEQLEFWHRSFQEFLAARGIAAQIEADQTKLLFENPERIYQPEWRDVMRLLGGVLRKQGKAKVENLFNSIVNQLDANPTLEAAARCVGLIGEMLRDLVKPQHPAPGGRYSELRHQVEGIFDPQRASRVPVQDRIAAADALGQVRRARAPRTSDEYWRPIEGGSYSIGSSPDKNHPLYDAERFDWELAPQEVTLESFQIARDPVTVGEFEEFIDDGGYGDPKYWKSGGFGEYGTAPHNWDDQQQNHARPVVSVSWHEALAFCAWAEQTLPTEAQWEAAARGHKGRRFPWGNSEHNQEQLNFDHQIGHPTPPGIFPTGSTPDGICDLAGNVWEWCLDHAKEPSQARGRTPEPVAAGVSRVYRGGSWDVHARVVRCAVRGHIPAGYQVNFLGFRLVRVQKS